MSPYYLSILEKSDKIGAGCKGPLGNSWNPV
jgi:hypothetical protein